MMFGLTLRHQIDGPDYCAEHNPAFASMHERYESAKDRIDILDGGCGQAGAMCSEKGGSAWLVLLPEAALSATLSAAPVNPQLPLGRRLSALSA